MPIPYVIDFTNMSLSTSLDEDKVLPPGMLNVENVELGLNRGTARKREGLITHASGGTNHPTGTKINAIAGLQVNGDNLTNTNIIAIVDDEIWKVASSAGSWSQVGTSVSGADVSPYRIAWGEDSSANPTVYFADKGPGVIRVTDSARTVLGGAVFTKGEAVEFYLNRLWVGNTTESGVERPDYLRWTVPGDDNDWASVGSGFLQVNLPGGGSSIGRGITGLRVFRDRLYIATEIGLYVLTGRTNATFGTQFIRRFNYINGATMYVTGDYLFFVDRDGIWQFNGTQAVNLTQRDHAAGFYDRITQGSRALATAGWDDAQGIYRAYFPTQREEWCFLFNSGQWYKKTWASTDLINVISPSLTISGTNQHIYFLGAVTNGKVYRWPGTFPTLDDDGNAITAKIKTGHIRLGEINGNIGDRYRIHSIDVETARQDAAGVVKLQITRDGSAGTQVSLTVGDAGASSEKFPTSYDGVDGNTQINVSDANLVGKYFQLEIQDDDSDSRMDLRRIVIWYEILAGKAG